MRHPSPIGSFLRCTAMALIAALIINNYVLVNARVVSGSMEGTIMTGSRVFCNRLAYLREPPGRFDIIVFNYRGRDGADVYFKRIIGLPGERVEIIGGEVYIDGGASPLRDPFVSAPSHGDYGPFFVPEDSYFVLGDNRANSSDSKDWDNPYVGIDDILGKAVLMYYPEIRVVKSHNDIGEVRIP